jgi:hypothetical protein
LSSFKYNQTIQDYINIISQEGRMEELIKACDYYHHEFIDKQYAFEWGFHFGQYLGKFCYGENIFRFEVDNTILYFIGPEEKVKEKLYNLL